MTIPPARARRQSGFTLVELMVAVTIGLLLTVVIANLFLGSRRSYATTEDVSRMQENMRFAYQLLSRTIHLAGYRSSPNAIQSTVFAAPNVALAGTEGSGTAADTITVRYQGGGDSSGTADGSIIDCSGQEIAPGVMATSSFSIANGADGQPALFCNGANESVPGVQNMQILYGEDTSGDLIADRYVNVAAVANPENVVSVRLALLFQTPGAQAGTTVDTKTYDLLGTVVGPFNDMRVRRLLVLTVNLRNRTP